MLRKFWGLCLKSKLRSACCLMLKGLDLYKYQNANTAQILCWKITIPMLDAHNARRLNSLNARLAPVCVYSVSEIAQKTQKMLNFGAQCSLSYRKAPCDVPSHPTASCQMRVASPPPHLSSDVVSPRRLLLALSVGLLFSRRPAPRSE